MLLTRERVWAFRACAGASLALDGSAIGYINGTVPSPGEAGMTGNSNLPTNTSVLALPGMPGMGGAGGAYINLFSGKVTYGGGGGGGSVSTSPSATYVGGAGALHEPVPSECPACMLRERPLSLRVAACEACVRCLLQCICALACPCQRSTAQAAGHRVPAMMF